MEHQEYVERTPNRNATDEFDESPHGEMKDQEDDDDRRYGRASTWEARTESFRQPNERSERGRDESGWIQRETGRWEHRTETSGGEESGTDEGVRYGGVSRSDSHQRHQSIGRRDETRDRRDSGREGRSGGRDSDRLIQGDETTGGRFRESERDVGNQTRERRQDTGQQIRGAGQHRSEDFGTRRRGGADTSGIQGSQRGSHVETGLSGRVGGQYGDRGQTGETGETRPQRRSEAEQDRRYGSRRGHGTHRRERPDR